MSLLYVPRVKTKELDAVLSKHKRNKQNKGALSKQSKVYVNGYGVRQHNMSLTKGGKLKHAVIIAKLEEIMDDINARPCCLTSQLRSKPRVL